MSLIEVILEYSDKHSRVLSLILLGIIVCGSIAGGIWIQNLNSIIAEKDKILEQRIQITEKESKILLASQNLSWKESNFQVTYAFNKLESSMQASINKLKDLAKEIENTARSNKRNSQKQPQLLDYSKTLTEQSENISKELQLVKKAISEPNLEVAKLEELVNYSSQSTDLSLLLLSILLVSSVVLNLYLLRRSRKVRKQN